MATLCTYGNPFPVFQTPNTHGIHKDPRDVNITATVRFSDIYKQNSEMNNSIQDMLTSVLTQVPPDDITTQVPPDDVTTQVSPDDITTQVPPDDITTQKSNRKNTPGFINISTEARETYDLPDHSIALTADPRGINTEIVEDDDSASLHSSEDGYEGIAPCVSRQTKEAVQTPCGGPVGRRPRRCNINNLYHMKLAAFSWIQNMTKTHATVQNDGRILSDIHLYRLNKTIRLDDQLGELEKSLQIYLMYLSEAGSVYSTMSLSTGDFRHLHGVLLTALCNLDNGISSDHMIYNVCLSRDLSIFYTQTIYILESLHTDIENAMTWKHCQGNV